jgi:hypothetical protein
VLFPGHEEETQEHVKKRKLNEEYYSKDESIDKESRKVSSPTRISKKSVGAKSYLDRNNPIRYEKNDRTFTGRSKVEQSENLLRRGKSDENVANSFHESKDGVIEIISSDEEDSGKHSKTQFQWKITNSKANGIDPSKVSSIQNQNIGIKNSKLASMDKICMGKSRSGPSDHEVSVSSSPIENTPKNSLHSINQPQSFSKVASSQLTIEKMVSDVGNRESTIVAENGKRDDDEEVSSLNPNALICWSCLTSLESEVFEGSHCLTNPFVHLHPLLG